MVFGTSCPQRHKFKCYTYHYNSKCSTQQKPKNYNWEVCSNTMYLNCFEHQHIATGATCFSVHGFRHRLGLVSICHVRESKNQVDRVPAFTEGTILGEDGLCNSN